jgi:hypothetical protein
MLPKREPCTALGIGRSVITEDLHGRPVQANVEQHIGRGELSPAQRAPGVSGLNRQGMCDVLCARALFEKILCDEEVDADGAAESL